MSMHVLCLLLCGVFVLHADVVPINDFDVVEEDRILNELQSGSMNAGSDPRFVVFLTDIGSRLTLPQTYDSAIHDFVLAIKNDQKWLEDKTLRRAITGLCRKITYSCSAENEHIPEVYGMLGEVTAKFPIDERYRLLGFMNRLDALRQKKIDAAGKAQQKADAEATKEAEKQKAADDKAAAVASAAAAKAESAEKEKKPRTSRAKTGRQKVLTSKDSSSEDSEFSDDQKSITPKKPRGRSRKAGAGDVAADASVSDPTSEPEGRQDRFEHPHAVLVSGSGDQSASVEGSGGAQTTVAEDSAQN